LAVGVGEATAAVRGARAAHATNKAAVTTRAAETATVLKQTAKGADAAQGLGKLGEVKPIGTVPQGLTEEAFKVSSKLIKDSVGGISHDIAVQGSRASGTARAASDIDYAIRVPKEQFESLVKEYFKSPTPGSAKERTMLHALNTGKIQAGEARLSGLRKQLESQLGMKVDISIVQKGGPFDNGPMIQLP